MCINIGVLIVNFFVYVNKCLGFFGLFNDLCVVNVMCKVLVKFFINVNATSSCANDVFFVNVVFVFDVVCSM